MTTGTVSKCMSSTDLHDGVWPSTRSNSRKSTKSTAYGSSASSHDTQSFDSLDDQESQVGPSFFEPDSDLDCADEPSGAGQKYDTDEEWAENPYQCAVNAQIHARQGCPQTWQGVPFFAWTTEQPSESDWTRLSWSSSRHSSKEQTDSGIIGNPQGSESEPSAEQTNPSSASRLMRFANTQRVDSPLDNHVVEDGAHRGQDARMKPDMTSTRFTHQRSMPEPAFPSASFGTRRGHVQQASLKSEAREFGAHRQAGNSAFATHSDQGGQSANSYAPAAAYDRFVAQVQQPENQWAASAGRSRQGEESRSKQFAKRPPAIKQVLRPLFGNDLNSVSALLKSAGPLNPKYFNTLINECIAASRHDSAMWCVEEMDRLGVAPNIITFNKVLHACAKSGSYELALQWWERMAPLNLSPSNVTYNTMINACAQARRPADAEAMLEEMISVGIPPCKLSFTAVIVAFASRGDASRAEIWLVRMRDMGLQGDLVMYNSFLNACAKAGDLQTAQRWTSQMIANGMTPNIRTYNTLIHACAKLGDTKVASSFYKDMITAGLRPDLFTFGSLIDVNAKVGNSADAEHWMEEMYAHNLTPNMVCFNSMLNACALAGDRTRAETWFHKMKQSGFRPSSITFNCMLAAVSPSVDEHCISKLMAEMIRKNIHPDAVTARTLHATLRHLQGVHRDAHLRQVYCIVVRVYLQCDRLHGAFHNLQDSKTSSTKAPNDFVAELVKTLQGSKSRDDVRIAQELQAMFSERLWTQGLQALPEAFSHEAGAANLSFAGAN